MKEDNKNIARLRRRSDIALNPDNMLGRRVRTWPGIGGEEVEGVCAAVDFDQHIIVLDLDTDKEPGRVWLVFEHIKCVDVESRGSSIG